MSTASLDADQEDGFEDYSHASPWERLEATLEDSLAQWVAAGPFGLVDGVHADNTCVGRKVGALPADNGHLLNSLTVCACTSAPQ